MLENCILNDIKDSRYVNKNLKDGSESAQGTAPLSTENKS
jgi:hypothetical protein